VDNWKYIFHRTDHDELYNLDADPLEVENLGSDSDQTDRMRGMKSLIQEMVSRSGPGHYAWCLDD